MTDLYDAVRKLSKQRAKIVHGLWATSELRPNSLLLYHQKQPQIAGKSTFDALGRVERRRTVTPASDAAFFKAIREAADLIVPKVFEEYKAKDFEKLIADITALESRTVWPMLKILAVRFRKPALLKTAESLQSREESASQSSRTSKAKSRRSRAV